METLIYVAIKTTKNNKFIGVTLYESVAAFEDCNPDASFKGETSLYGEGYIYDDAMMIVYLTPRGIWRIEE